MFLDARVSCLVVGNYDEAMSNVSLSQPFMIFTSIFDSLLSHL